MLLTIDSMIREQPMGAGFCLRAEPKREHVAAAGLRQLPEVEVFCPRLRLRKSTVRGPVWFTEPLFPGYLFARFAYLSAHRQVRAASGVRGFVQFGNSIGLLSNEALGEIRAWLGNGEVAQVEEPFYAGQKVRIVQGPFRECDARVVQLLPARERVQVLIDWMGRGIDAEFHAVDLLPAVQLRGLSREAGEVGTSRAGSSQ